MLVQRIAVVAQRDAEGADILILAEYVVVWTGFGMSFQEVGRQQRICNIHKPM
jgi:hypothetical protein